MRRRYRHGKRSFAFSNPFKTHPIIVLIMNACAGKRLGAAVEMNSRSVETFSSARGRLHRVLYVRIYSVDPPANLEVCKYEVTIRYECMTSV